MCVKVISFVIHCVLFLFDRTILVAFEYDYKRTLIIDIFRFLVVSLLLFLECTNTSFTMIFIDIYISLCSSKTQILREMFVFATQYSVYE